MRQWFLLSVCLILAAMSLLIIKSVAPDLLNKQLLFFVLGFILFFVITKFNYTWLEILGKAAFYFILVLLFLLLILGKTTRGVTAWIPLFSGFKFQPSQFVLPFFLLFFLSWWQQLAKITWKNWLKLLFIWFIPGLLIFLEPDFGSSLIYFISSGVLLFFLPISKKILIYFLVSLPIIALLAFVFLLRPNQQERVTSFFGGYHEDQQSSYHARQALIAIGSGKILGRGLGFGVQSHLRFLPERQTDFIFASFAEETGFLGSSFVVLVYLSLILFLFWHAIKAKKITTRVWLTSTAMMIFIQAGINIGMNLSLLPITGITLPLFSYGGSSAISVFLMISIAQKMIETENWTNTLVID